MVQARPTPSERMCMYSAIIHITERYCFSEYRDIYASRTPSSIIDTTMLYNMNDSEVTGFFNLDRAVELQGALVQNQDIYSKLTANTVLFSSKDANFIISAVDNTGASISVNNTNVIKSRETHTYFTLDITFT